MFISLSVSSPLPRLLLPNAPGSAEIPVILSPSAGDLEGEMDEINFTRLVLIADMSEGEDDDNNSMDW